MSTTLLPERCRCRSHRKTGTVFCPTKDCWCHDRPLKHVLLLPKVDGVHRDVFGRRSERVFEPSAPPSTTDDEARTVIGVDPGEPSTFVRARFYPDGRIKVEDSWTA